jgi:hypothetical protein
MVDFGLHMRDEHAGVPALAARHRKLFYQQHTLKIRLVASAMDRFV